MRRRATLSALAGAFLVVPAAASAVWSATANGAAAAPAATLAPPPTVTIAWDPTVHLSWSASPSTWATGYRVLRGVTPDSLTQLGADRPGSPATVDDSPGAGTHYYAVVAYHQGWTSQRSTVVRREDRDYVLTGGAASNGATGCAAAASVSAIRQGHPLTGPLASAVLGGTTYGLCTDAWTTGQSLPSGVTTVSAYISNAHATNTCPVTINVIVGGTSLGSASVSVPGGQSASAPTVWSVPTVAHAFTTGQRLTVTLTPTKGGGCNNSTIYAGTTTYPSKVTLTS